MSASQDLQLACADLLKVGIIGTSKLPLLARRQKEIVSDIEAAVASFGICIYVMPPFPTRAMQGVPFVFFEGAELRVRILEYPDLNTSGADGYELIDAVAIALHWMNPGGILAHPLELASRPVEMVEDKEKRVIDIIFNATFQLNPEP